MNPRAALVGFLLVASTTATARAADGDPSAEAPSGQSASPDVPLRWDLGLRGTLGTGALARASICLSSPCTAGTDTRPYVFYGAQVYASLGEPSAHFRWQTTLEFLYGPDWGSSNFGRVVGGTALSGIRFLSNPGGPASLLVELNAGLGYFGCSNTDVSAPMAVLSLRLGAGFRPFELLGQVTVDSIILEQITSATIDLGYSPSFF
jgi:hypothetical protein